MRENSAWVLLDADVHIVVDNWCRSHVDGYTDGYMLASDSIKGHRRLRGDCQVSLRASGRMTWTMHRGYELCKTCCHRPHLLSERKCDSCLGMRPGQPLQSWGSIQDWRSSLGRSLEKSHPFLRLGSLVKNATTRRLLIIVLRPSWKFGIQWLDDFCLTHEILDHGSLHQHCSAGSDQV